MTTHESEFATMAEAHDYLLQQGYETEMVAPNTRVMVRGDDVMLIENIGGEVSVTESDFWKKRIHRRNYGY